jgi:hypothetical protein
MHHYLIVWSNPVAGRDDEYNRWYTDVHVRDVMQHTKGAIAVQRFRRASPGPRAGQSPSGHGYLAIYEMSDPAKFTAGHAIVFTDAMPVSDAFDMHTTLDAYYDPVIECTNEPGTVADACVLVQRIPEATFTPDNLAWFRDQLMLRLMREPGVLTGFLGKASNHQMMPIGTDAAGVVVLRTRDPAATLAAWKALASDPGGRLSGAHPSIEAFEPLMPRLMSYDVIHADPIARERTERARRALGDRVHRTPIYPLPR